jgi:shikimate kinase
LRFWPSDKLAQLADKGCNATFCDGANLFHVSAGAFTIFAVVDTGLDRGLAACGAFDDAAVVLCAGTKFAKATSAAISALESPQLTNFVFPCISKSKLKSIV